MTKPIAEMTLEEMAAIGRKVLEKREQEQAGAKERRAIKTQLYAAWLAGDIKFPVSK